MNMNKPMINIDVLKQAFKNIVDGCYSYDQYCSSIKAIKEFLNNVPDYYFSVPEIVDFSKIYKAICMDFDFTPIIYYRDERNRIIIEDVKSILIKVIIYEHQVINVKVIDDYDASYLYQLILCKTYINFDLFIDYKKNPD